MALGGGKFGKKAGAGAAPAKAGKFGKGAAKSEEPETDEKPAKVGKFGGGKGGAKTSRGSGRVGWTGSGSEKEPMLLPGSYRVKVTGCEVLEKPRGAKNAGRLTFKAKLEVIEAGEGAESKVGGAYCFLSLLSTDAGTNERNRFIRTAAGFDSDEAFGEMVAEYADGDAQAGADLFVFAVEGEANVFGEDGNPIADRLVDVVVTRGKDDDNGGFYRNYQWEPVSEDEQS